MRITAENDRELEILSRRLEALRHVLGPEVTLEAPKLIGHRLPELLALELAAVDLERCYASGSKEAARRVTPEPVT